MPATLAEAVQGALFGAAVGDAVGRPWEGAPPAEDGAARVARSVTAGLRYTDDTQLTWILADHLCRHPEVEPDRLVADILRHAEPWRGYGAGMRALLELWRSGVPWPQAARAVFPDGSRGNGAAMRVAPVGVLWAHDPARLAEVAARQAAVTHAHPVGVDGAVLVATAVGMAATAARFTRDELVAVADRAETDALREGLRRACDLPAGTPPAAVVAALGAGVTADRSVPAALWVAATAEDVVAAVTRAVALGGDADTIAAMAAAVRGAATGGVPRGWWQALEDGPGGRRDLERAAATLTTVAETLRRGT